jgi:hypothetical protein
MPLLLGRLFAGDLDLAILRNPDLARDLKIDQEKGMSWLGCASVAAGATLILRCRSYNFQFFLQM